MLAKNPEHTADIKTNFADGNSVNTLYDLYKLQVKKANDFLDKDIFKNINQNKKDIIKNYINESYDINFIIRHEGSLFNESQIIYYIVKDSSLKENLKDQGIIEIIINENKKTENDEIQKYLKEKKELKEEEYKAFNEDNS